MTITRFESDDRDGGLRIHSFDLGGLSLLVGLSGAGKTRILNAIEAVVRCGTGQGSILGNDSWTLELRDSTGQQWKWSATTRGEPFRMVVEKIVQGSTVLLERTEEKITFGDRAMPMLKESESLISLLRAEPEIQPLFQLLSAIRSSQATSRTLDFGDAKSFSTLLTSFDSISTLQTSKFPLIHRAAVMQRSFSRHYERLLDAFREIFPIVDKVDVDVVPMGESDGKMIRFQYSLHVVGGQIPMRGSRWSSGMLRTWLHLLELTLSPPGTVLMIDEYENSLGVNCLPALTRHLLERAGDVQMILTSHHPYVINHIPVENWLLVQRSGRDVHVKPASSIPRLTGTSRQAAFTRLMSDEAFLV